MRSIQTLGLGCIAAFSFGATAQDAATPVPGARHAGVELSPGWQARADPAPPNRLRYLERSRCRVATGCSASAALPRANRPQAYLDALDLGSYGPMNFKFTGDRVKVKVRF